MYTYRESLADFKVGLTPRARARARARVAVRSSVRRGTETFDPTILTSAFINKRTSDGAAYLASFSPALTHRQSSIIPNVIAA